MSGKKILFSFLGLYLIVVFGHVFFNHPDWISLEKTSSSSQKKPKIGYIPISCALLPVLSQLPDYGGNQEVTFIRFGGWPEVKEALAAGKIDGAILLVPIILSLKSSGIDLKIVSFTSRNGSSLVVHKESGITSIENLVGKRLAIPSRFSGHAFMINKALKAKGFSLADVDVREAPPPEMPSLLRQKVVDAITAAEPWMEMPVHQGFGQRLATADELWPGYINAVLVFRGEFVANNVDLVKRTVDRIHRLAADLISRRIDLITAGRDYAKFLNQDPKVWESLLTPIDRIISFGNISAQRVDVERFSNEMVSQGFLKEFVSGQDLIFHPNEESR